MASFEQNLIGMINYPILHRIGVRYLFRRRWQTGLMLIGIMLGVAVMVAIDLANLSASRAFDLSTAAIAGKATHQITGGPQGIPQDSYVELRLSGIKADLAPVISEYVQSPELGDRPLTLLGIDPFAEPPFRSYLGGDGEASPAQLAAFLTQPGAVILSEPVANQYGIATCRSTFQVQDDENCKINLIIGGYTKTARVVGLVSPADGLSTRALDSLILTDISTAQELTGRLNNIDQIDLILSEEQISQFESLLPTGVQLQTVAARAGAVQEMTSAFRINLTALSLLALLVGLFLIYNTITFSVIQRRQLFGTLRCLGFTRQQIFWLVAIEATLIGAIGSAAGLALGVLLGQGALQLVTQTINDLFFVVSVRGVQVPGESLVKGFLIGFLATILSAVPPALEAASVSPRAALYRSGLENKAQSAVRIIALLGAILASGGGLALVLVKTNNLIFSFAGTFSVIVGFAMITPWLMVILLTIIIPASRNVFGLLGAMAPRDIINSSSRTSIAVAALMVAVSVTIGVSIMISSFRYTVSTWLSQTLQGDIYISAPGQNATTPATAIDPLSIEIAQAYPGVTDVAQLRAVVVNSPGGLVNLSAIDHPIRDQEVFISLVSDPETVWQLLKDGAVVVSEPFANRFNIKKLGSTIELFTPAGLQSFTVVGIFSDYASTQGTIRMELETYRRYWQDFDITALALYLDPGANVDSVVRGLQEKYRGAQQLLIRPNQAIRSEALLVFDRTFAITGAMQLLATLVAFVGVLSAMFSLQLDKQRQLGILRAIGLTTRQLWGIVMIQTGMMGSIAGVLAMPTGYVLAIILIYIINLRSFGWTLQLQVLPQPFLLALAVALFAALLAGLYPAYRLGKLMTAEALRSD